MILASYNSQQMPPATSPSQTARMVVKAYQNQDMIALETCYGKDIETLRKDREITFERKFYLAVGAKKIEIVDAEQLLQISDYAYVGVFFDFVKKSGEKIPYYDYFIVYTANDGSCKIMTVKDVPREVYDYFEENSGKASETELHESYLQREKEYIMAYPKSSDQIYGAFKSLINNIPHDMEKNIRFISIIFLIAIMQLWILLIWVYKERVNNRSEIKHKEKKKIRERLKSIKSKR